MFHIDVSRSVMTAALVAAGAFMWPVAACAQDSANQAASAPELGNIEFPTSGAPAVQERFLEGVLWLHSFEYGNAGEAFREAQRLDPDFAMAYWGEALSYTHPVWNQQDVRAARAALERLAPTPEARAAEAPTPREKAYLHAVEVLYGEGSKAERDTAYSLAMEELAARSPDDPEAKAFYALSILGLSQGVRNVPAYMRAAAVAQEVLRENPRHPGAAHYLIHAFDDPVHAPLGLHAARIYSGIAPDAPHAQHMTTHIFLALGMWDEVVAQNEIAAGVGQPGTELRPGHYTAWLSYGLLQQGRYEEARALLEEVRANLRTASDAGETFGQRMYLADMRAHFLVAVDDAADPVAGWDIELGSGRHGGDARATDAFADGLAALDRGDRAAAEDALEALERLAAATGRDGAASDGDADPYHGVPAILRDELEAMLHLAEGEGAAGTDAAGTDAAGTDAAGTDDGTERALTLVRSAAELEDSLPVAFGPPVIPKPTHELLGEMLLEAGRPADAAQQFRRALELAPGRALSLLGLARAAEAAGNTAEARRAREALERVWDEADSGIKSLAEAVEG